MDRYAVVGNPIAHSRSPWIHAAFAHQTGQALRLRGPARPARPLRRDRSARFRAEGGRGLNVTVPFKLEAFALADRRTPRARGGRRGQHARLRRGRHPRRQHRRRRPGARPCGQPRLSTRRAPHPPARRRRRHPRRAAAAARQRTRRPVHRQPHRRTRRRNWPGLSPRMPARHASRAAVSTRSPASASTWSSTPPPPASPASCRRFRPACTPQARSPTT